MVIFDSEGRTSSVWEEACEILQEVQTDTEEDSDEEEEQRHTGKLPCPQKILYPLEDIEMEWHYENAFGSSLFNEGNTCFINATLQCLNYTAPLVHYLLSEHHYDNCKVDGFCMTCEMGRHMIRSFRKCESNAIISPENILVNLKKIAPNMVLGEQEDAHEFLRHVLDAMQIACLHGQTNLDEESKETTAINQIFGGLLRSQIKCTECGAVSSKYDHFMDLSLHITDLYFLEAALSLLIKKESIEDFTCGECCQKVTITKRLSIETPPNVLTIQLNRFSWFQQEKISHHVNFSTHLDLRPYMSQKNGKPVLYELYGVLVHLELKDPLKRLPADHRMA